MDSVGTFETLIILLIVVLPGATYTWSYERETSVSHAGVGDRLLRLVGASAVFVTLFAPALYQLNRTFVVTGDIAAGNPLPWWLWLLPLAYLALPYALGVIIGRSVRHGRRWVRPLTGPAPAPRAWDHLFARPPRAGWLRLRLLDGSWIFGVWGGPEAKTTDRNPLTSYAAGYPEPQDLFLVDTAYLDEDGMVVPDEHGNPELRGIGILVRWDQVAYAEFIEA